MSICWILFASVCIWWEGVRYSSTVPWAFIWIDVNEEIIPRIWGPRLRNWLRGVPYILWSRIIDQQYSGKRFLDGKHKVDLKHCAFHISQGYVVLEQTSERPILLDNPSSSSTHIQEEKWSIIPIGGSEPTSSCGMSSWNILHPHCAGAGVVLSSLLFRTSIMEPNGLDGVETMFSVFCSPVSDSKCIFK